MGLFKRAEKRSTEQPKQGTVDASALLTQIFSDEVITKEKALNIPAVQGCVEYIAGIIAMLPIKLYKDDNGEAKEQKDDYRVKLLNDETGDILTPFAMKKAAVMDYILTGGGYIFISKEGNRIASLHYVEKNYISCMKNTDPIFKTADILVDGRRYRDFEFIKLLRNTKDGVEGRGIIDDNPVIMGTAYNSLKYERNLITRGGNKKGFLTAEKRVAKEVIDEIRKAWRELYSNNENNMIILNDGLKFQESSATSVELQLNEQKRTNTEEICSIFNLSPDIISGKANEDQQAAAVRAAIIPKLKDFETELNKCLLLESEKAEYYFVFDVTELLKGDTLKRYQAYQIGLQSNFLQPDEVRYKEDLQALGLNFIKLGLNDVLYNPKTGEVYTPNTNKTQNIKDGALKTEEENNSEKGIDNSENSGIIKSSLENRYNENHDEKGRFSSGMSVKLPDGSRGTIPKESKITKIVAFAGKGTKKPVRIADFLEKQYISPASEWRKLRGESLVIDKKGKKRRAEIHWFEDNNGNQVKMKVKRWF